MIKSFKIRLYPTKQQEELMWKHIGCCRYIWNYMLDVQEKRYQNGEKHLSAFDMINLLKPLKNDGEHDWLNEVSSKSLQTSCRDLDKAYQKLFEKTARQPKFKSRKTAKPNFPVRYDSVYFTINEVNIEKLGKVKYKSDHVFPIGKGAVKVTNPRISYKLGKWILSFGMECENQVHELNDYNVGIDLGIKELAVVAYGDEQLVFHNINKSRKMRQLNKQLKHVQRSISRKYEASRKRNGDKYVKTNNIVKEEEKARKLYSRITNIRNNYLHQTTHAIVSLFPKRVVMEDLNVAGMMRNGHLSKSIAACCWSEFIRQMQYKCEWSGIEFIQVGRFYPSSKTCSCCGSIKKDLTLSVRTYKCDCGAVLDRDYNAALNLSRYTA